MGRINGLSFGTIVLPVICATDEELASHHKVLGELDKASGGKRIWQEQAQVS